jgi:hypothetical protein
MPRKQRGRDLLWGNTPNNLRTSDKAPPPKGPQHLPTDHPRTKLLPHRPWGTLLQTIANILIIRKEDTKVL